MKKAIVIGCGIGGLGVIRSLGIKGLRVIALYYDNTDFAQVSKYVHESAKIPHPLKEEKEFVNLLVSNSNKWNGALIIETFDEITVSISKNKHELSKYYKIATADWEVLRYFIDKSETYKLAERCGVCYPKTFLPRTLYELSEIKHEINYPCILKPIFSHEFVMKFKYKNFIANNYKDLTSKFNICIDSGIDVMLQEIIPGPPFNLYNLMIYLDSRGDVTARFLRLKVRQNPPRFGVTRVGVSGDRVSELEYYTEKLLKGVNFRGLATAEFKKDPRDNQFKLLEINPRITGSNWLATYCGVNFPWIVYMDHVEGRQVEVNDYKKEVYWINIYQDIVNTVFRRREERLSLKDFLKPYFAKNKTFAVLSADDIMPFLKQLAILPLKYFRFIKLNLTGKYRRMSRYY